LKLLANLVGVKAVDASRNLVQAILHRKVACHLNDALARLGRVLTDSRETLNYLRMPLAEEKGLVSALAKSVEEFAHRTEVRLVVDSTANPSRTTGWSSASNTRIFSPMLILRVTAIPGG
jgi:signal transduction histidine kinase